MEPHRGEIIFIVPRAPITPIYTPATSSTVCGPARPVADVEIGQHSTTLPLLGNIAFRTGHKIRWNAEREEIVDDREASALLGRQTRAAWNLV